MVTKEDIENADADGIIGIITGLVEDEIHYMEEYLDKGSSGAAVQIERVRCEAHKMTQEEESLFGIAVIRLKQMTASMTDDQLHQAYSRFGTYFNANFVLAELVRRDNADGLLDAALLYINGDERNGIFRNKEIAVQLLNESCQAGCELAGGYLMNIEDHFTETDNPQLYVIHVKAATTTIALMNKIFFTVGMVSETVDAESGMLQIPFSKVMKCLVGSPCYQGLVRYVENTDDGIDITVVCNHSSLEPFMWALRHTFHDIEGCSAQHIAWDSIR